MARLTFARKSALGRCMVACPCGFFGGGAGLMTVFVVSGCADPQIEVELTHIRECFLAAPMITDVRLFTGVGPRMHG
jgi:hypothetical protein